MTDETLDVGSLFREAQRVDGAAARSAYVRQRCQDDPSTGEVVLQLLTVWDEIRGATLDQKRSVPEGADCAPTVTAPIPMTGQVGETLGRYRLLKPIGEGGFGRVFLAEQREPVRRNVALKIIKPGMDTNRVIARFEVERQTLALLDHPNIAKVFDAGTTHAGRPYFVMELVAGVPITEYCDHHHLAIRDRLVLFGQVCRAVQHAHTKGIIHRDLKPGNILVTTQDDRPFAKIIDFGIAKAAYATLIDGTAFTEQHQPLGTPAYMSPEQIEGAGDIDTRSDIYSLGVLLYELLTGCTPFDAEELRRAGLNEMHQIIREVEPPSPSTRISLSRNTLSVVAANRAIDPTHLQSALRGELDWIAMKCLEKNRTRRYDSAGSLAAEITNYLNGEAVLAAPPSTAYRLRKFARRHRVGVAAGATVAVGLILGFGAALIGLRSAIHARNAEAVARNEAESARQVASDNARRATAEAARSRAALGFVAEMFAAVDPVQAYGHDVTVAEILDPAAEKVTRAFADDPEAEAVVRHVLGRAYGNLGRYPEAQRELEEALELRRSLGQDDDPQTLDVLHNLGTILLATGNTGRAIGVLQRTAEKRSEKLGHSHRDTLATRSVLAFAKQLNGDLTEAMADIRSVLADQEQALGPDDRDTLESMCSLADMLGSAGKVEEALGVAHEASRRATSAHGAHSELALMAGSIEADVLTTLGRYRDAADLLEEVVRGKEQLYGLDHPKTLVSIDLLARTLDSLYEDDRAISLSRIVVDRATKSLGESHSTTLTYMNNLAQALRQAGKLDEAEPIYRRVLALRRETDGKEAPETLKVMSNLGLLLMDRHVPSEALPLFRDALEGLKKALPPDHWMLGVAMFNLGRCQTALGDFTAAETTLSDSYALMKGSLGATHSRTLEVRSAMADLYDASGKPDKARAWRDQK